MRKAYMWLLRIALVSLVVGIVMAGISISLGGIEAVKIGESTKVEYSNIDTVYNADEVSRLELAFKWGEVQIKEGDVLSFTAINAPEGAFADAGITSDGTLRICENSIKETVKIGPFIKIPAEWIGYTDGISPKYTLTIPQGMKFDEVVISTGAGTLDVNALNASAINGDFGAGEVNMTNIECDNLTLDNGAGEFNLGDVFASGKIIVRSGAGEFNVNGKVSADIIEFDCGAGSVDVEGIFANNTSIDSGMGEFNIEYIETSNLDASIGMGEVNIKGVITDNADIDISAGEMNLEIYGESEDYYITADKTAGNILVDGKSIGEAYGKSDAHGKIDVDISAGEVNIDFE